MSDEQLEHAIAAWIREQYTFDDVHVVNIVDEAVRLIRVACYDQAMASRPTP